MDSDATIRSVSFEEALSNAIRLAERASDSGVSDASREQAARLATAWGTIAHAVATKYAASATKYAVPLT
jgi:hypothetical protein